MIKPIISKQISKLAMMLGLGGLDGAIALAALSGLFVMENIVEIAFLFMAGPGAIVTAILLEGKVKQRMLVALVAGLIATLIVILAAGIGPKLLDKLNVPVLKLVGGLSVVGIGLLIMGLKIPEKIPLVIMLSGLVISLIWK
jgi:hypothetical protein